LIRLIRLTKQTKLKKLLPPKLIKLIKLLPPKLIKVPTKANPRPKNPTKKKHK